MSGKCAFSVGAGDRLYRMRQFDVVLFQFQDILHGVGDSGRKSRAPSQNADNNCRRRLSSTRFAADVRLAGFRARSWNETSVASKFRPPRSRPQVERRPPRVAWERGVVHGEKSRDARASNCRLPLKSSRLRKVCHGMVNKSFISADREPRLG